MEKRKHRMTVCHPWPGVVHHLLYPFPHIRLITVNTAVGTGRLVSLEGAFLKTPAGIFTEFPAFSAEITTGAVLTLTVQVNHRFNGLLLPEYSPVCGFRHNNNFLNLLYPCDIEKSSYAV
jgi:hypothetical protein